MKIIDNLPIWEHEDFVMRNPMVDCKAGNMVIGWMIVDKEALSKAVDAFRYFLNKQKVQFSYVEGLLQLWDAFNPDLEAIPYPTLDCCLMNLGQLQFEGYDEWVKIMKFNEFTKPYSDEYTKLKARTYLLSEEHSALQSKLGLDDAAASNNK